MGNCEKLVIQWWLRLKKAEETTQTQGEEANSTQKGPTLYQYHMSHSKCLVPWHYNLHNSGKVWTSNPHKTIRDYNFKRSRCFWVSLCLRKSPTAHKGQVQRSLFYVVLGLGLVLDTEVVRSPLWIGHGLDISADARSAADYCVLPHKTFVGQNHGKQEQRSQKLLVWSTDLFWPRGPGSRNLVTPEAVSSVGFNLFLICLMHLYFVLCAY